MTDQTDHVSDCDLSRDRLAKLVKRAAAAWAERTAARDAVAAAWQALYTTPAEMFPGRVLALLDAHDEAVKAARTWDGQARTLALYTLQGEDGRVTTWADMADIIGQDTDGWAVADLDAYPRRASSRAPGPEARQAEEVHRAHRARLADMARLVGPSRVLDVLEAGR